MEQNVNITTLFLQAVILEDEEEDWQAEEFCVKVMCEHEEVSICQGHV